MRRVLSIDRVESFLKRGGFSIERADLQNKYPSLRVRNVDYCFFSSPSGKVALVGSEKDWLIGFDSESELADYVSAMLSSDPRPGKIEEEIQAKNGMLSKIFEEAWADISMVKGKDEAIQSYKKLRKIYPHALREIRFLLICSLLGNFIRRNSSAIWVCRISSCGRLDEIGVHSKDRLADVGDFAGHFWKKVNFPIESLDIELVKDVAQMCKSHAESSSLDQYRIL